MLVQTTQQKVLKVMASVLVRCQRAQEDKEEVTIATEINEITHLQFLVKDHWPLSMLEKEKIPIGVYAVRNLDDWLPDLALIIMTLDNVLRADGRGADALLLRLGNG